MDLENIPVLVTGGSRGLGLGLVEALGSRHARVTVMARSEEALASVHDRLGVATVRADVTDKAAAHRILSETRPRLLVLNAGATPPMERLDRISWDDFTTTWMTDVRAGLYWLQAALKLPLERGSRVLVVSSGAAVNGSPMSGGYAGAKHMLWVMARYANGVAKEEDLSMRFQVIVPRQMVGGTGVGDAGSTAYAKSMGISTEQFLARFGTAMPPRDFGEKVMSVLEDPQFDTGMAFGLKGDTGITVLEEAAT